MRPEVMMLVLPALLALVFLLWSQFQFRMLKARAERSEKQAEDARRLKSEFIANVSHELKTPLNTIVGYVDLIREGKYGLITIEQSDILRRVRDAAGRLLGIVNNLLDFSGADLGKIEVRITDFSLNDEVRSSLELIEKLAEQKGVVIRAEFGSDAGVVRTDREKLRQAVTNVLANAVKFTEKGSVTVQTSALEDGAFALIEVRDTGIGIKESELPYVFEEFRQADGSIRRNYGGTGLGLSIAQKFIHFIGGEIGMASKVGEGTTVRIVIPRLIEHPMRREEERAPAAKALRHMA